MNLTKGQLIIVGVVLLIVIVIIAAALGLIPGIFKSNSGDPNFPSGAVELSLWGVGDSDMAMRALSDAYKSVHNNVRITYKKFTSPSEYESALVNALAQGTGPDIFMIENTWVDKHGGKMFPAYSTLVGAQAVADVFPDVISADLVRNGQVYALPLYMDSIMLLYNKDIFNAKAILSPPQTWDDVVAQIPTLRTIDQAKKITQSAIALGGATSISNNVGILSLLMFQNGAILQKPQETGVRFDAAAQKALTFYMQFANPISINYTWNDGLGQARDAFANGKVAMILDTHEAISIIKEKNPFIRIGVVMVPQLNTQSPISYAQYRALAVSRQTAQPYVAWDFIRFASATSAHSQYLTTGDHLSALKSEMSALLGTENDAFVKSALVAKSWRQNDPDVVTQSFTAMIQNITAGKTTIEQALRAAAEEINRAASNSLL